METAKKGQRKKNVSPFSNESRNAYVIEHLTGTMLALLKEKPFSDISISELCDGAGVGRTSFYRNYSEKEDILRKYIQSSYSQWTKLHGASDAAPSDSDGADLIFVYLDENRDFYSLLYQQKLLRLLKEAMLDSVGPRKEMPNAVAYAMAFLVNGIYGWIEEWFARGLQESAEEMAAEAKKLSSVGPSQIG